LGVGEAAYVLDDVGVGYGEGGGGSARGGKGKTGMTGRLMFEYRVIE
jgi:hypothetical protein